MDAQVLTAIILPIVVAVALACWIIAVMRANKHPAHQHPGQRPRRPVAGGSFEATGGRQLTPNPEAVPGRQGGGYETPPGDTARGR